MDSKILMIMCVVLTLLLFSTGCSKNDSNMTGNTINNNSELSENEYEINIEKLEIYHFHATNQCYSCITVGDYAEETVNTYFADELKSEKIVFGHINGELPENKDLVIKYGATGSSLWLGTYSKDGMFTPEQNINVWYKISNKNDYMNYLKGVIEQKLAGN
jgi:hypothetical protein